jgi:23S rRNA A2030 N6-methylase RlmJ
VFETNSAYAEYVLPISDKKQYGIFYVYEHMVNQCLHNSVMLKILDKIDFINNRRYYGSPALAMTILKNKDTMFYFHDIEKAALDNITEFSIKLDIQDRAKTICGDSITSFLCEQPGYGFNQNDLIFIDPYSPFDSNESGKSFFDIFNKAYGSLSQTILWYGYEDLDSKNKIIGKLQDISSGFPEIPIYTFDIWQKCMNTFTCRNNPGVPGCGIAVANLSKDSILKIQTYLDIIGKLYINATYQGEDASLSTGHIFIKSGSNIDS